MSDIQNAPAAAGAIAPGLNPAAPTAAPQQGTQKFLMDLDSNLQIADGIIRKTAGYGLSDILKKVMAGKDGDVLKSDGSPITDLGPQQQAAEPQGLNTEKIYQALIETLDFTIQMKGDIKISELKVLLTEHKKSLMDALKEKLK